MEKEEIDNLLYSRNTEHKNNYADRYIDHYLEQYRIYIHIFNSTNDRQVKVNEFFLGVNTAIIGILGYLEGKGVVDKPVIFIMVPLVGIAICACWYRIVRSYKELNRTKFQVIDSVEEKLPLSLFSTEREILKKKKEDTNYKSFSSIELYIPVIFSALYSIIFVSNVPWVPMLKSLHLML